MGGGGRALSTANGSFKGSVMLSEGSRTKVELCCGPHANRGLEDPYYIYPYNARYYYAICAGI